MADNITLPGATRGVATDEVTHSGDASQAVQLVRPVAVTGSEGSKTVIDLDIDSNGVQRTRGSFATVSTDVTRPADTTAYAVNDALSDSTSAPTTGGFTFTSAARISGGSGIITDAFFVTSNDPGTTLQGELMLFNQAVTNINDNAAFAITDAEAKTLIGIIPFTLEDIGNNGYYHARNLNIGFTCVGTANLRFLVRVKNAYTPASAEVFTFALKVIRVD